jgi:hypothetical protein
MTAGQSRITPVVPDWAVVSAPRARRAIEGIVAAGHYDSRFGELDSPASLVLAHILRLYARRGRAPAVGELAAAAALPESSIKEQLILLRARDLVLLNPTGEAILGAYPFSEAVTGHSVTFEGTGHTLATMCAIDALGAGAMCRDDVTIRSACGTCGGDIVALTSDRGMTLGPILPIDACLWVGLRPSCGCAADTLCRELLFFCSDEHLVWWRKGRSDNGHRLTPEEAFQVGKALFIDRVMMERM